MWDNFNSRFTSVKTRLSQVAKDVFDQAEELAAPRADDSSTFSDSQLPAEHSGSEVSALKARIQADKSRSSDQRRAGQGTQRPTSFGIIRPPAETVQPEPCHGDWPETSAPAANGDGPLHSPDTARLKAQVSQLKAELINATQSHEEEMERVDSQHRMEVGALTADLEATRRQAAAQEGAGDE
eukprot:CAMPEP_0177616180 /NCGR_PEP_ID=MMETSP0419_2-20121207/23969_1 /TAXON_ID=582737 /ORGANISM="Tetraselmis sp., Strain GSL018" /LENGTH=182 /DNA_ID=CAMNT_0019114123 /DNA_START=97 /DNA_END=643 /DNA_ORIENTATION=+